MDLGETRAPAHLLLDSRPVCEVTVRSPGCTVDLGPDPRVHLLELVRTDAAGHVTERVSRWVNRPGIEPEVLVAGACEATRGTCEFDVGWGHPRKLDPKRLSLQLDGVLRWEGVVHHVSLPFAKAAPPQVVVCDVEFPDGTRATYTRTLYAFNPEEAQASLSSVPVIPEPGVDALAALRGAGFPVRTVEETEPDVTFVTPEYVLMPMVELAAKPSGGRRQLLPAEGSDAFEKIRVAFPDESLSADEIPLRRLGVVGPAGRPPSRFSRYADAVAAAGYTLGASPRARAVVLILAGFDRPNISSFTAAQARAYLAEVMVPLVVWRVGDVKAPEWPDGPHIDGRRSLHAALADLRVSLGHQRMAWLEGSRDTRHLGRWLAPGVALAGRVSSHPDAEWISQAGESAGSPPPMRSDGPDGGPVHALVTSSDGSTAFAGTHGGVFRKRRGDASWEPASNGLTIAPVRSLAIGPGVPATVAAGTDAGLFVSAGGGDRWQRPTGELASVAISFVAFDPSSPRVLYAGSAGRGVFRSDDGGRTLLQTGMDHGDFRALAVDPTGHSLLAASESGIFRSADRGLTWAEAGKLPARVLDLSIDGASGRRILAATDGEGLFASADSGATWSKSGLVRTLLTSVRTAPGAPGRVVAGSPVGVYASEDAGATWKLARVGPAEAVAFETADNVLAATARGVLRRAGPAPWRDATHGPDRPGRVRGDGRGRPSRRALRGDIDGPLALGRRRCAGGVPSPGFPTASRPTRWPTRGPGGPEVLRRNLRKHRAQQRARPDLDLFSGPRGLSLRRRLFLPIPTSRWPRRAMVCSSPRTAALHWSLAGFRPRKNLRAAARRGCASDPPGRLRRHGGRRRLPHAPTARASWKPGGHRSSPTASCAASSSARKTARSCSPGRTRASFAASNRGEHWEPSSEGLPEAPVYAAPV